MLNRFRVLSLCAIAIGALTASDARAQDPATSLEYPKLLGFSCRSLALRPDDAETDCHVAGIRFKKAFFAERTEPALAGVKPEQTQVPLLESTLLLYRKPESDPRNPALQHVEYRGFLAWAVIDPGTGILRAAGLIDEKIDREFAGYSLNESWAPGQFRAAILGAVAEHLPGQVADELRVVWAMPDGPPGWSEPAVKAQWPSKASRAACGGLLPEETDRERVTETARLALRAVAVGPELGGVKGPWKGTLVFCPGGAPRITLDVEGEGLKSRARCDLDGSVTKAKPPGVAGLCASAFYHDLRRGLIRARESEKVRQ